MLKENEWITINRVLLEIYEIKNVNELAERLLKMIRMLIPYSNGYFLVFDKDEEINRKESSFIGIKESIQEKYLSYFYNVDYLKYIYEFTKETETYRDTDILDDSIRKKTEFYTDFLRPNNIPFGAGILLMKDEKMLGIINLFRSSELGDFSDKDMYILDALKFHLANILYDIISKKEEKTEVNKVVQVMALNNDLSEREVEVIKLINEGKTNAQIAEILLISLSTVKKHVYNIYSKIGVKSRMQLVAYMNEI
ncbi:MAG: LuxR family transcriptional regulator [Clostridiales bacterium]|nr:LuxR family transcriptional regulator [Clostridiales bacterium]